MVQNDIISIDKSHLEYFIQPSLGKVEIVISLNLIPKALRIPFTFLIVLVWSLSVSQLPAQKKVEVKKKENKVEEKNETEKKETDNEAETKKQEKKKPLPIIKISKETTYFTEPLLKNGRVDYLAAINEHHKPEGLIPAKNGAIYLVKATGSYEGGKEHFAKLLKALGVNKDGKGLMALPKNDDSVLIHFDKFLNLRTASLPEDKKQKFKTEMMDKFYDTMDKPWKKEDRPEIWKWIQMNEQPLKMVATGTEQPFFYLPYVWSKEEEKKGGVLIAVLLPIVQESRTFARLLVKRAMNHLGENRPKEAANDLLIIHKLARQIGHRGTLIEGLVGIAIESIALKGDAHLAQHPKFSAKQLKDYTQKVQSLSSVSDMKESLNLFERCVCLDAIQHIALTDDDELAKSILEIDQVFPKQMRNLLFDWNLILKTFNSYFDELEKINQKPYLARKKLLEEKNKELKKMKSKLNLTEIVAKGIFFGTKYRSKILSSIFMNLLLPPHVPVFNAEERTLMKQDLSAIHFHLEIYKRDNGKYPASLNALVPKYLAKIPKERFAAKQDLKYQSNGKSFKLYSIGYDGLDNKGVTREQSSDGWDEVIEVK